jgi:hypothetical protein
MNFDEEIEKLRIAQTKLANSTFEMRRLQRKADALLADRERNMQRRIIKGERSEAFALERASRDDWIADYAADGYGIDDIKWKLYAVHGLVVSRDHIKGIVLRKRHG